MFRAFNVTCGDQIKQLDANYIAAGKKLADLNDQRVRDGLEHFVHAAKIDASALQSHWFPTLEADVFISHASVDRDVALALAGFLKEVFGIECFIDSCVWGYSYDLLKQIDDVFCKNVTEGSYSYEKRNGTTSHVHMMLATALAEMMDRAEAVFFVSSPASVAIVDSIRAVGSPWIYYELMLTKLLRRRPLEDYRKTLNEEKRADFSAERQQLPFLYTPSFDSLTQMNIDAFIAWLESWMLQGEPDYALDVLYKINP